MTYKESYQQCNTLDDLKKEVGKDMRVAIMMGDLELRKPVIEKAVTEVSEEKGWEWTDR